MPDPLTLPAPARSPHATSALSHYVGPAVPAERGKSRPEGQTRGKRSETSADRSRLPPRTPATGQGGKVKQSPPVKQTFAIQGFARLAGGYQQSMRANTIDSILRDVIVHPDPKDLSGRHPSCPPTGCWEHRLKPGGNGYRTVRLEGRIRRLHRLVYEHLRGSIPAGYVPDHLCRNRGCCNPWHLEAVPEQVNILRGEGITAAHAAKTHCPKGHPYTGDNLHAGADGTRYCRACRREWGRQWREANRESHRESGRRYREKNREKEHARYQQWREANLEALRARNREYQQRRRALQKALQEPHRSP